MSLILRNKTIPFGGNAPYFRFMSYFLSYRLSTQPAFPCSKLTIETLEQGVKYVQSQ